MSTSTVSRRLQLFAASLLVTAGLASTARADVVDCMPERARAMTDRIDMRCQGINRWFIAFRSNTDAAALNQMLSLLNSSILAGKPVKVYYNLDSASNGILTAIEIFR